MNILEKGLTTEEFENYCEDRANELEGTTYFGQRDEEIPHYEGLQRRHIYEEETDDEIVIIYRSYMDENNNEPLYDIYDTID